MKQLGAFARPKKNFLFTFLFFVLNKLLSSHFTLGPTLGFILSWNFFYLKNQVKYFFSILSKKSKDLFKSRFR